MSRRRWLGGALAAAALLLVLGRLLAAWYVEQQWYQGLDAAAVWHARVAAAATLRIGSGLFAAAFIFVNLYAVRQSVVSLVLPRRVGNLDIGEEVPGRALLTVAALIAVVLGALLSLSGEHWLTYLLASDGRTFGEADPYFQADLGFYVARLPFEIVLYDWSLLLLGVTAVTVVLLYALTPSLRLGRAGLYVSGYVRRHLTMLGGVLLLLLSWSYRLDLFGLLLNGTGPGGSFGWTDHKVGMPGLLLLAIATLAIALVVLWAGWNGQTRLAFFALAGVVILSLVVRHVAPAIMDRSGDGVNTDVRERPYLATRSAYTRRAFGIDRIAIADTLVGFGSLSDIASGTSLWDGGALVASLAEGEAGPGEDRMIGWSHGSAGLTATLPEPVLTPIGGPGTRWRVARVGVSLPPVDGRPPLSVGSISPARLGAPAVYPGGAPYSVLADSAGRVIGASLGSMTARLAHAWALQNPRLADGGELPLVRPTLVRRRDVRTRIEAITPFFLQGAISPAVAGDTLYWMLHLYATSRHYPMAERLEVAGKRLAYLRPAAVAVVNGATGLVTLLPVRDPDPLARGWISRFPSLFQTTSQPLPGAVTAAIPPHEEVLVAQAQALGRHGVRAMPADARRVPLLEPHLLGTDEPLAGRLPPVATTAGEVMLALPVLDERERVAGVLMATGGTRRRTIWRAEPAPSVPWEAVLEQLRTAPPGEVVTHGAVRVVPLRTGLAFVQSRYRLRPDGSPAFVGIALLHADSVQGGPTLTSLAGVLPLDRPTRGAVPDADAVRLWDRMREALRRSDWTTFGIAFDSLGIMLGRTPR